MDPLTDPTESASNSVVSIDNTVTYILFGLGVVLAFALLLSTFTQVNRVAVKTTRPQVAPARVPQAELGGTRPSPRKR